MLDYHLSHLRVNNQHVFSFTINAVFFKRMRILYLRLLANMCRPLEFDTVNSEEAVGILSCCHKNLLLGKVLRSVEDQVLGVLRPR